MSDRGEIEEIVCEAKSDDENGKPKNNDEETEIFSTKKKITHAIRQNPLTHMGEKSEKPTLFEKLKRAFSTDDNYGGGFIDDELCDGGLLGDSDDIFTELVNKIKTAKTDKEEKYKEENSGQAQKSVESAAENTGDAQPKETEQTAENQAQGNNPAQSKTGEESKTEEAADNKKPDGEETDQENNETKKDNIKNTDAESNAPENSGEASNVTAEAKPDGDENTGVNTGEQLKIPDDAWVAETLTDSSYDVEDALEESDFHFIFAEENGEAADETVKEKDEEDKKDTEKVSQQALQTGNITSGDTEQKPVDSSESENTEAAGTEKQAAEQSDGEKSETKAESEDTGTSENTDTVQQGTEPSAEDKTAEENKAAAESEEEPTDENSEDKSKAENKEPAEKNTENSTEAENTKKAELAEQSADTSKAENAGGKSDEEKKDAAESAQQAAEQSSEEKSGDKAAAENKEADESVDAAVNSTLENKDEEKTDEAVEAENKKSAEQAGDKSAESAKAENKSKSIAGKLKGICSNAKKKLITMWNEKIPEAEEKPKVEESDGDVLTAELFVSDKKEESEEESAAKRGNIRAATEEEHIQMLEGLGGEPKSDGGKDSAASEDSATAHIKVIKNDDAATTEIDTAKVRESLNVISRPKAEEKAGEEDEDFEILLEEPDILNKKPEASGERAETQLYDKELTEEEKQQQAANQMVLDKVKKVEEWISAQKDSVSAESAEKSARDYEREFGEVKPITQLEITDYIAPGAAEQIKVKAGKFSESVRSEYEFYIGYRRLKNVAKNQKRINDVSKAINENASAKAAEEESIPDGAPQRTRAKEEESRESFAKSRDRIRSSSRHLDSEDSETPDSVEYRSEEDKDKVKRFIKQDYDKSKKRCTLTSVLLLAMFILFCFSGKFTASAADAAAGGSGSERVFAVINLIIYGAAVFVCKDTIISGLKPLKKFKASSDTSVAIACAVTALQSILLLISPSFFFRGSLNVCTLIATLALLLNSLGKHMTTKKAKENFKFVSAPFGKYTAKFYHDQRMSAKMLSGTTVDKSEIVFQKRTSFLKHFLKLTYAPDPGDDISSKFAIPTMVFSVIISIIYAIVQSGGFFGFISVLSIMLCMAVPMCGKLLGSLPLYHLSKNTLRNQAMVVGYPAVEHFSEAGAIMVDAKELYPEGSVHMNGIKTFSSRRIDDALLAAAAVMVSAGGAMAGMFDGIIQGRKEDVLPPVDSVIYEDGKGLIGWVNKERVLVGNRYLLEEHGIEPPSIDYEEQYRTDGNEVTYLATSGELVAMFIIGYSANRRVMDVLRRMESNGMCFLVRTMDVNITPEKISKDFGIYYKSVKVLPTSMGNVIRDEMIGKEKTSPAYVATKGGVAPLGRAVSGCIKAKKNIALSIAIQVIEVLISLLLVTTIVLFAGVEQIGSFEMFFLSIFWAAAVLIAPFIQKS